MFGISYDKSTGTNGAGSRTMDAVSSTQIILSDLKIRVYEYMLADSAYSLATYVGIHDALEGKLSAGNFNPAHAYFFCGGNGLTFGTFPGNPGEYKRTSCTIF